MSAADPVFRVRRRGFPAATRTGDDVRILDPTLFERLQPPFTIALRPLRWWMTCRVVRRSAWHLWLRKLA